MSLRAYVVGTAKFFYYDLGPSLLGAFLGRVVRPAVIKRMTGHDVVVARDIYQRIRGIRNTNGFRVRSALDISIRRNHVFREGEAIDLPDMDRPIQTKYSIQLHNAERAKRHFDLRIQLGGRAVSWAIPMKGIRSALLRLNRPGERWMAIRQPDHVLSFMEFEGEIKEGRGKGHVALVDSGICDVFKIKDGEVHVRLHGSMKGDYVLVPTKDSGLIVSKAVPPGEPWSKPRYTRKSEEALDGFDETGRVAENKIDGASAKLVVGERGNRIFSHRISKRTGQLIEYTDKMPHLRDLKIAAPPGTEVTGEVFHPQGVNFTAGVLNSSVERSRALQKEYGPLKYAIFNMRKLGEASTDSLPYGERRQECIKLVDSPLLVVPSSADKNFADFYQRVIVGQRVPSDGIVIKGLNEAYGETPWTKVKPSDTVDCVVVGVEPGTDGKYLHSLGALKVKCPDGSQVNVGSGFKDWERQWIWDHRNEILGETAKVNFHVRHGKTTNTGPVFDDWHPDKSEVALKMYSDILGVNPYQLKSAAKHKSG